METADMVKVAVSAAPYSIDKPYSYLVPESLAAAAVPGVRVMVPFGRGNKESEGLILARVQEPKLPGSKALRQVLDPEPVLDKAGIDLALWMRGRYFCTVFEAVKTILPAGLWYGLREIWSLAMEPETARSAAAATGIGAAGMFVINFNFLGINLSQIPKWKFWEGGVTWNSVGLFLLPIISAGLSVLSMIVSQKTNQMSSSDPASNPTSKSMMIISPLISLWIGFTMPAGLCIYWIANSALMMVQEWLCGKILKKDYEKARAEMEEAARKSKEAEKERRRQAAQRKAEAIASGKKKAAQQPKREKGVDLSASREGIRAYARGRAYDPNRYTLTPYHDPDDKYKQKDPDLEPLTEEEKRILAEEGIEIPEEPAVEETPVEEAPAAEEPAPEETPAEGDYEAPYSDEDGKE